MPKPSPLLFVDTNIWLDFYRTRTDAALSLLRHLDSIRSQIIMTYQVEMEFKKHRQEAILDGFNAMKAPTGISRPGWFSDAKTARALQKDLKNAEQRIKRLKERFKRALKNPSVSDPVYKVCQRCFHREDEITLTRDSTLKNLIRRKAFRRFLLGCPPRKHDDTSIGDAVNWEWIIHCASLSGSPIHIVSRDSDYGKSFEDLTYLNDHLLQEFKERISRKRSISLHCKLSEALKHFAVSVTAEEEEAEKEISKPKPEDAAKNIGDLIRALPTATSAAQETLSGYFAELLHVLKSEPKGEQTSWTLSTAPPVPPSTPLPAQTPPIPSTKKDKG